MGKYTTKINLKFWVHTIKAGAEVRFLRERKDGLFVVQTVKRVPGLDYRPRFVVSSKDIQFKEE